MTHHLTPVPSGPPDAAGRPFLGTTHFDPAPLVRLFAQTDPHKAEDLICRMLEDVAQRLEILQQARQQGALDKIQRAARRIELVAGHMGLVEVTTAAAHVICSAAQRDSVALDATLARLERGFDVAVNEVWTFRDAR